MGKVFFIRKDIGYVLNEQNRVLSEHRQILEEIKKVQSASPQTIVERIIEKTVVTEAPAKHEEVVFIPDEPVFIPRSEKAEVNLNVMSNSEDAKETKEKARKIRRTKKTEPEDSETV
jgi:hypothetical protein